MANSTEHVERGYVTSQAEPTKEMVDKRFSKEPHIKKSVEKIAPIKSYGSDSPQVTLVGWGSTKGPALEAIKILEEEGIQAQYVQIRVMEPFPEKLEGHLKGKTVLFENNRTAMLGKLVKMNTGLGFDSIGLRYDGRPITTPEMVSKVKEVLV